MYVGNVDATHLQNWMFDLQSGKIDLTYNNKQACDYSFQENFEEDYCTATGCNEQGTVTITNCTFAYDSLNFDRTLKSVSIYN